MYKRHNGQISMLESPEMFGSLPLDAEEAPASFALFFQLAPNGDSKLAE